MNRKRFVVEEDQRVDEDQAELVRGDVITAAKIVILCALMVFAVVIYYGVFN